MWLRIVMVVVFYSGIRHIKSRAAAYATRWVFVLRGESLSREEQGAVALYPAYLSCIRAHAA